MENNCCDKIEDRSFEIDQTEAVENRYRSAANYKEKCLCMPVPFNSDYLRAIPDSIVERDYGCGDPTLWVKKGDRVLDLGSGSGKNAFICSQVVGPSGYVLGIDRNEEMLSLSRKAIMEFSKNIGYQNIDFIKSSIECIDDLNEKDQPIVKDSSFDIILSNCVLNLVNPKSRIKLLKNIKRVLRPNGRIAISDIVSNKKVSIELQKDPELWSGCISGAWQEDEFINDFLKLGFYDLTFADRSKEPWKIIDDIEFRSVTLVGKLRSN
tara:strand:+ start:15403 stop:16200 length:798 start_codon:yes stop_codon:yes gene_type:complete